MSRAIAHDARSSIAVLAASSRSDERERACEGANQVAWVEHAYIEHHRFVWRTLARLGVPEAVLEDALQEVFVVLHRRRSEFDARSSVRTWLCGIAMRIGHRWRSRAARAPVVSPTLDVPADPERTAADRQALARVDAALQQLVPERREVFVLCEIEGLTGDEVAQLSGVNRNTVYSRLRLARRDFHAALTALGYIDEVGHE